MTTEQKKDLFAELEALHRKNELARTVGPDYYEPGRMEYLDQHDGRYEAESGTIVLRFESKGTRYDGRTEQIEKVKIGDVIQIVRDEENPYNPNNFLLLTKNGQDVGNMPAELCNVIAPLYDAGELRFEHATVSFVEPISKRNRHAKQAVLFVELQAKLI